MIAGALDPPQPPAAALPLMAVAIWCVWAAHCAPEITSDLKSAPEVSSGLKSAPEVPSDLKPDPELLSDLKPAPELPSDQETDPEASPVGEAAPMPPEVSALAVDPPMEAASLYRLSASPHTLSTSSVSAVSRSQAITRFPAPPQLPSGHKPVPEFPLVREAAPMPPEVPAVTVDPPLEVAPPYKLSASLPTLSVSSISAFPRSQTAPPGRSASWFLFRLG
ncbi:uncharacterized protein LOC127161226, partial [Labeo rohita]|uniref:uncharacterized protein LOC127161226 n=1 Tax=Labeo rohita TaxID=84645 RepID=UPI0021E29534